jgi:hypothetical protein
MFFSLSRDASSASFAEIGADGSRYHGKPRDHGSFKAVQTDTLLELSGEAHRPRCRANGRRRRASCQSRPKSVMQPNPIKLQNIRNVTRLGGVN